MLDGLLNYDIMLTSWGLVIAIGVFFFVVQVILCMNFCRRLRYQERLLRRLRRDYEAGGSGRADARTNIKKAPWYQWVLSHFQPDATRRSCVFNREDALQELDARIASNGGYLLLQRMGVMAPLLGVVLTVAGFYQLNVREDAQSLQSILQAVTPLVAGVGTGAVLALINQVLLHVAGRRVEAIRLAGRSWFDTVIWRNLGSREELTVTSSQGVEDFIRGTLEDVERLASALARAAEMNAALTSLPERIRMILDQKLSSKQSHASPAANEPFVTRLPRTAR
jgi:hypothetical protein